MLEDGVTERIKALLRSDMPPVQFKLLGTLRMMVDGHGKQNAGKQLHALLKSCRWYSSLILIQ